MNWNPLSWLRELYHWVLRWSDHRHNVKFLAAVSFAEASFFPIPPDILLLSMGGSNPKRALRYALIASIFSVLGGVFGYLIGYWTWAAISDFFFQYVFSEAKFQVVNEWFRRYDFLTIFIASFTPIPYKVFTIAAGAAQLSFPYFIAAAIVGRSTRFFLVGGTLYFFGDRMRTFIEKYFELLSMLFAVLLILGIVIYYSIWS